MQIIATRLNLPETVYIVPHNDQYIFRFFATKGELPLCCHGVLGAAYYLFSSRHLNHIKAKSYRDNIHIKVNCCDSLVSMSIANNGKILATDIDTLIIDKMLGINKMIIDQDLPCAIASIGSPKLFVPIISRSCLFAIVPNLDLISQWCKDNAINGIYVYSKDTENTDTHYLGRNFNPLFSHQEDIATGTAAAALCQMLCINNNIAEHTYVIEQGANLGRSSKIYISITTDNVEIKGQAYYS